MYDKNSDLMIAAGQYGKEKKYWLEKFSGEITYSHFLYDLSRSETDHKYETAVIKLEDALNSRLIKVISGSDQRLLVMLLTGIAILLKKYSTEKDIILGTAICKQEDRGEFVNTVLPIKIRIEEHVTFRQLLTVMRTTFQEAHEHANYPVERLIYHLGLPRTGAKASLFDTAVILENIQDKAAIRHTGNNMTFIFNREGECIDGKVEYNAKYYKESTICQIANHLQNLLRDVLFEVDKPCGEVCILSGKEKAQLLHEFNDTAAEYPKNKTIHEYFEEQAKKTPGHIALEYNDVVLTYKDLDERADKIAVYLRKRYAVEADDFAAVMLNRSEKMIVAILGILKAGAAYAPMDISFPRERLKFMLGDAEPKVVISEKDVYTVFSFYKDYAFEDIDEILEKPVDPGNLEIAHSPAQLAYVIYTSGSTGKPKGVMIEHRSLVNLIASRKREFDICAGERVLLFFSISFDASVEQMFTALCSGARLVVIDKSVLLDKDRFKDFIRAGKVTHLHVFPTFLKRLHVKDRGKLKRILAGGEVVPLSLVKEWCTLCDFYNEYGPTETTITSSWFHAVEAEENRDALPIGKPVANTKIYILDKEKKILPVGVPGELCISGIGLARGYLKRPGLTEEKFVPNPYLPDQRMYLTGDLAKWLPDGNIEFLGRVDNQIKIRGYRIELGEIESRLSKMAGVREAVVLDRESETGDKYLCAYILFDRPKSERERDTDGLSLKKIKEALFEYLPGYMVPSYYVELENIPLTPNGKVDRRALPGLDIGAKEYVAPRNEVESILQDLWSTVLDIKKEKIGIDSNFFELGGHSLKASDLLSMIYEKFNIKIPLVEMFENPFIRDLALLIDLSAGDKKEKDDAERKEVTI